MNYKNIPEEKIQTLNKLSLIAGGIFTALAIVTLMTTAGNGLQAMDLLVIPLLPVSAALLLFKNKIPYEYKAYLLSGLFFLGANMAFLYNSLYSVSIPQFMSGLLVCNVYLDRKHAIVYLLASILVIAVFAVLNTTGLLAPLHDTTGLFLNTGIWTAAVLTLVMVFGLSLLTIGHICNLLNSRLLALDEANRKLQAIYRESRDLRELIPICSGCKSIRDDKGYWISVGQYLSNYPDNDVEENICPDCLQKYGAELKA